MKSHIGLDHALRGPANSRSATHGGVHLWLARGVDVVTVLAWMGHASVATTNLYLHHLGTLCGQGRISQSEPAGAHGEYTEAR